MSLSLASGKIVRICRIAALGFAISARQNGAEQINMVIVDTDILIDAGRNVDEAVECLHKIEHKFSAAVSSITQMELIIGCRDKRELHSLQRFLNRFHIIGIDEQVSDTAIELLKKYRNFMSKYLDIFIDISDESIDRILEFEKLIKKSPYFVNAHYNLGTIYLKGKMHEQAKQVLKRVVELKPKHAEAQLNLGYIYYQEGNLDDAIEAYKKGLEIKPDNLRAHLSLGHIYDKKKMYEEAMVEYNTALQIDPTAEPAKIAVGYMEVIKSLEDNIQDVPDDYLSLIHLGHVYYAKKMYKEAITAYKKALEISPANMVAESAMEKAIVASLEP